MVDSEVVQIQWERARPGLAKDPTRGFQHGERCCWKAGTIQLGMGALVKDPGPPKLGTWVSKQPLTIPVSGAADSGLQSGLVRTNDQRTRRSRANEKARYVQAQIVFP